MNKNDEIVLSTAIYFIKAILKHGEPNIESINELYEIERGNKKVIVNHLKAVNNIISEAIKILDNQGGCD